MIESICYTCPYTLQKKLIGDVDKLPYINLQITKGATRDQKAQIVKEFTETLVNVLGKKPEHTHIVIEEIDDENWGFSGILTDDFKKQ
ncbi:tautomerase family protein [Brevibacillus parabrevis]|uniref:tautomerase family protein n=1 Tax=Brevibacillus parabrevis TaxID=54914 RepID=UPI000B138C72|nr:4-oxalocrotonate tautomerase family protein [Brevibacillus parabrevis]